MKIGLSSEKWRSTLLPLNSKIHHAIQSLEESSMQIVLLVSDGKLVGTITDGDIRRAFLKGLSLDSDIFDVANRSPLVVPPGIAREHVLQLMQANRVHQLPVVDESGLVVGLYVWDSIVSPEPLGNYMVIMAGGKGTRLRPHTENCPKPMLEISGKPMLQHIIERAKRDGFSNFIISVHYLGEMIEEYFGDGRNFGVDISYLKEPSPLGTAGCLSTLPIAPDRPLVVTNGDVITDVHYNEILDFHERHAADATMAVRQYEMQNQFGVVKVSGVEIEGFEEKPIYRSHINAGIYVLSPEVLSLLERNVHCDMPSLFMKIKENSGTAVVYPMHEPWLDVGRPEDLSKANNAT